MSDNKPEHIVEREKLSKLKILLQNDYFDAGIDRALNLLKGKNNKYAEFLLDSFYGKYDFQTCIKTMQWFNDFVKRAYIPIYLSRD